MAKSDKASLIGSWAFLIGVILAVFLGFLPSNPTMVGILVIVGLIVGLLNVKDKEAMPFLLSGVVLIIASSQGQGFTQGLSGSIPDVLNGILKALLAIFVPATIIVAIKNVFGLARN